VVIDEAFVNQLISAWEAGHLDFKLIHHANPADLIHDIICLANAFHEGDRFLVLGIADNRQVEGLAGTAGRRTQAMIIDALRNVGFNHLPTIRLVEVTFNSGKVVDVVVIKDLPEKPYFLLRDYRSGNRTVRAGVPYTRNGDTNTPLDQCPEDIKTERMYRERFGLDRPPAVRVMNYLRDAAGWKYGYDERNSMFFHYEQFPEFTFAAPGENSRDYSEPWTRTFPDPEAEKQEFYLKFHGTILAPVTMIWLDGNRFFTALPEGKSFEGSDRKFYQSFYFIGGSVKHVVSEMVSVVYKDQNGFPVSNDLALFPSKEEAVTRLTADFQAGMREYTFFETTEGTGRWFAVRRGQRSELPARPARSS
jgi:hypothetical protein